MDGGAAAAQSFILGSLGDELERTGVARPSPDAKSLLQQHVQAAGLGVPHYAVLRTEGPDHERRFLTAVEVEGRQVGQGWGRSKKEAEQNAAHQALERGWIAKTGSKEEAGDGDAT